MTREFIDFVASHQDDDTARLLLSAARYPHIDMPLAVQQIEGRRTAAAKWPSLLDCPTFRYPPRLNREQASSEATARLKATLAGTPTSVADLTGGMGIDALALARVASHVDYVERDPALCTLMEHNCKVLGVNNIEVHCADSLQWLAEGGRRHDLLYIDPARRSATGARVSGLEDCTPNLLPHLPSLLEQGGELLVKTSPMIDIDLATGQLGHIGEVHVVSLRGECKEVLFRCRAGHRGEATLHCHLLPEGEAAPVPPFTRSEEAAATPAFCEAPEAYLLEPDAALMKAAPYRLLCQWYGLRKLAPNTHLYTAPAVPEGFPGRAFRIVQELKPSRRAVAEALPEGKAHVAVRNYPVPADALQRQLGLREGGELTLVATTLGSHHTAFLCQQTNISR